MLGELVCVDGMDPIQGEFSLSISGSRPSPTTVVASPIYRGPGPLPKCTREGIQQRPNLKGDN